MKKLILTSLLFAGTTLTGFAFVAAPPSVSTVTVTGVKSTSATFSASVNPNGSSTTVRVLWSTSPTSFSDSAGTEPGSSSTALTGNSPITVNRELPTATGGATTPLLPNTTYYYAIGAKSSGGYTRSTTQSFTTQPLNPPSSFSVSASEITQTSIPLLWATPTEKVRLVYSTTSFPVSATTGTLGYDGTAGSVTVTGLAAGTTYFFKIYGKASHLSPTAVYSSTGSELIITTLPVSGTPTVTIEPEKTGTIVLGGSQSSVTFSSTGTTSGSLSAEYVVSTPNNGLDLPEFGLSLRGEVLLNAIAPVSWTFTATGLTDFTYSVDLDISGIPGIQDDSSLVIVKRESEIDPWTSPVNGTTVTMSRPSAGILRVSGLTSFSQFGIASNGLENTLPVELASFSASHTGASVTINWKTVSETDNAGFFIEKAEIKSSSVEDINSCCADPASFTSQSNWISIGFENGQGTSTEGKNYQVSDRANSGLWVYRLRQVDLNGNESIVGIQGLFIEGVTEFEVAGNYPNPFNPETQIRFSLPDAGQVTVKVLDVLGREIAEVVSARLTEGNHSVPFSGAGLSAGVYFYQVKFGNQVKTGRMMLLK
ncbi:MAG: T9SS type A sorting domain-containing protein [Bacteroidetes bacterium]|nr:T9SS type A sorting domain-containing protein [Bacteroidota bacterium]